MRGPRIKSGDDPRIQKRRLFNERCFAVSNAWMPGSRPQLSGLINQCVPHAIVTAPVFAAFPAQDMNDLAQL
jgi:hypothetical protein